MVDHDGYLPRHVNRSGTVALAKVRFAVTIVDGRCVVDRMSAGAAYPTEREPTRLFTLNRGEIGRFRANFRFVGMCCSPAWYYQEWAVHIGFRERRDDMFLACQRPDHDFDDRVNLYGSMRHRPS